MEKSVTEGRKGHHKGSHGRGKHGGTGMRRPGREVCVCVTPKITLDSERQNTLVGPGVRKCG